MQIICPCGEINGLSLVTKRELDIWKESIADLHTQEVAVSVNSHDLEPSAFSSLLREMQPSMVKVYEDAQNTFRERGGRGKPQPNKPYCELPDGSKIALDYEGIPPLASNPMTLSLPDCDTIQLCRADDGTERVHSMDCIIISQKSSGEFHGRVTITADLLPKLFEGMHASYESSVPPEKLPDPALPQPSQNVRDRIDASRCNNMREMFGNRMCPNCYSGPIGENECGSLRNHHGEQRWGHGGARYVNRNHCRFCGFLGSNIHEYPLFDPRLFERTAGQRKKQELKSMVRLLSELENCMNQLPTVLDTFAKDQGTTLGGTPTSIPFLISSIPVHSLQHHLASTMSTVTRYAAYQQHEKVHQQQLMLSESDRQKMELLVSCLKVDEMHSDKFLQLVMAIIKESGSGIKQGTLIPAGRTLLLSLVFAVMSKEIGLKQLEALLQSHSRVSQATSHLLAAFVRDCVPCGLHPIIIPSSDDGFNFVDFDRPSQLYALRFLEISMGQKCQKTVSELTKLPLIECLLALTRYMDLPAMHRFALNPNRCQLLEEFFTWFNQVTVRQGVAPTKELIRIWITNFEPRQQDRGVAAGDGMEGGRVDPLLHRMELDREFRDMMPLHMRERMMRRRDRMMMHMHEPHDDLRLREWMMEEDPFFHEMMHNVMMHDDAHFHDGP